jgi:hypothetical protein
MTDDFSTSHEATILNNIQSGGVYVSLHVNNVDKQEPDGTDEVSAADYSRASTAESDWSNSGSNPTTMSNDVEVTWTASANNDWGTVTHFALWDDTAANGGTPYTSTIPLDQDQTIQTGMEVTANSGALTFEVQ